jgi:hypothetical protein
MIPDTFAPLPTSAFEREADEERTKLIGRTATGIGFLIVAVLLLWIPVVSIVGLVLGALGVIFLARGADLFGYRHTMSVWISVLIFAVAYYRAFFLVDRGLLSALTKPAPAPPDPGL